MNSPVRLGVSPAYSNPIGFFFFLVRGFETLFHHTGTLGCMVCLFPELFLLVYLHTNVGPSAWPAASPGPPTAALPTVVLQQLVVSLLHPSCLSPLLRPVLMNVSSLTPWLSDFHTIQLSGSSHYFLFLNLLLSYLWLCREAKSIYLRLQLGRKS